ncbi:MAG TPA: hypothetical protein VF533_19640 [Solirubrobacteraceae bacterium]|jgi:hypothetical protein
MAALTRRQKAARRRIEQAIGVAAPALDLLLFFGHHASRVAGRNDIDPEPPRRVSEGAAARRIERGISRTRSDG